MKTAYCICAALAVCAQIGSLHAEMVTSGYVIRGLTIGGPAGPSGTPTGHTCDFSGEAVDINGTMTGASVNCAVNGKKNAVRAGLPLRFGAYCAVSHPPNGGRLITAPVRGNVNHCDLSGIKPKAAEQQFGGAVWR